MRAWCELTTNPYLSGKVETHSPSAIDPYGGAIYRDCRQQSRSAWYGHRRGAAVIQYERALFWLAVLQQTALNRTIAPEARIFEGVRKGIEDGGNKSGIPTVNGATFSTTATPENRWSIAAQAALCLPRMAEKIRGKNGLTPATGSSWPAGASGKTAFTARLFSSAEIDEHSPQSAVQIGSPITQKLMSDFLGTRLPRRIGKMQHG